MICEIVDSIDNDTHTLFIGKLIEADIYSEKEEMSYGYYQEHKEELLKVTTAKGKTAWIHSLLLLQLYDAIVLFYVLLFLVIFLLFLYHYYLTHLITRF